MLESDDHFEEFEADEATAAFRSLETLTNNGVGLGYLGISPGTSGPPDAARDALTQLEAHVGAVRVAARSRDLPGGRR